MYNEYINKLRSSAVFALFTADTKTIKQNFRRVNYVKNNSINRT